MFEAHTDEGNATCVRIVGNGAVVRSVKTEVAPPYRLRILAGDVPVLWAAGHPSRWGLVAYIDGSFPPFARFDAAECRRVREHRPNDANWWASWGVRFAQALHEAGFIGRGNWALERAHITDAPSATTIAGLTHRVIDRTNHDERTGSNVEIEWSLAGENGLLPLRELGPADEGRIKAFTKLASENTLPPALVWWHSGLQRHLVLDGHVRLEAFRRADKPIIALALCEERPSRITHEFEEAAERRAAEVARAVADPVVQARVISRVYADRPPADQATTALTLDGGAQLWDREAEARSPIFARRVAELLENRR